MKEFSITDVVELFDDEKLYFVTDILGDDEILFLSYNKYKAIEVPFNKVVNRWTQKLS